MSLPRRIATTANIKTQTLLTLARAGIVRPTRPDRLWHVAYALHQWGPTPAAGVGPQRIRALARPMRRSGRSGRMMPASASVLTVWSFVVTCLLMDTTRHPLISGA